MHIVRVRHTDSSSGALVQQLDAAKERCTALETERDQHASQFAELQAALVPEDTQDSDATPESQTIVQQCASLRLQASTSRRDAEEAAAALALAKDRVAELEAQLQAATGTVCVAV